MGELLSLHLQSSTFLPATIADFLKQLRSVPNVAGRAARIDDFVRRLQDEMAKIDAFKRELPLCVILLRDVIKALKEESARLTSQPTEAVLEEFIPLRKCEDESKSSKISPKEPDFREKKNWMSSVQLWSANLDPQVKKNEEKPVFGSVETLGKISNGGGGGGFMPFKRHCAFPGTVSSMKENKMELLIENPSEEGKLGLSSSSGAASGRFKRSNFSCVYNPHSVEQQQGSRKQRRCWAPELHSLFISALEKLGGPQVATPKQIRELMKVDGLTNDEVKSHLQKYRLHSRKLQNGGGSSSLHGNEPLSLGNLWNQHEDQCRESSRASNSQSRSPEGPLHLAINSGGTSTTGGDSMEDDIDGESHHSWKKPHIHKLAKEGF